MFDEFLKNFRKMLGGPTSVVGGVAKEAAKQEKTPQKVWGFEEDKTNYSDGKKFEDLIWRDVVARNNDTGKEFKFSVGYDQDGKIAGAKTKINDTTSRGYIGKDSVSNFFKSNFDRDATDYSIFDDPGHDDGYKHVIFDSKNDGAFIPSQALNSKRKSQAIPIVKDGADKPTSSISDELRRLRLRGAAERGQSYVMEDESVSEPAWNGTFVPWRKDATIGVEQYNDFSKNRDMFDRMTAEWSLEDDPQKRQNILKDYSDKYGFANNNIFKDMLEQLSWHDYGDANDHDKPGAKFNIFGRMEWLRDIRRQMDEADTQYNPYKKA